MSNKFVCEQSFAKINLAIDVTGERPDGYHTVEMIMQSLLLCDNVTIAVSDAEQSSVRVGMPGVPEDDGNLALRAAKLLQKQLGLTKHVHINIKKHIPVAGGMGGGSANAAAVLRGMNKLFDLRLSERELCSYGVQLGADVPFCIVQGTALAEGIGDQLTILPPAPKLYVLVLNPGFEQPTAAIYRNITQEKIKRRPQIGQMTAAIRRGNADAILACCGNVLEYSAFELHPELAEIKAHLERLGLTALMSGSGATMLGLSADRKAVQKAYEKLEYNFPFIKVTETF